MKFTRTQAALLTLLTGKVHGPFEDARHLAEVIVGADRDELGPLTMTSLSVPLHKAASAAVFGEMTPDETDDLDEDELVALGEVIRPYYRNL